MLVFHIWIFSPSTVIKPSNQSLNKEHGSCTHLISPLYSSHTNSNKPLLIPYSQYRLRYAVVMKDTQITVASYNEIKSLPLILQKYSALALLVKMQHYTHFDLMRSLSIYPPTNTMAGDLTMAGHTAGLSMFWPRSDTCPSYWPEMITWYPTSSDLQFYTCPKRQVTMFTLPSKHVLIFFTLLTIPVSHYLHDAIHYPQFSASCSITPPHSHQWPGSWRRKSAWHSLPPLVLS